MLVIYMAKKKNKIKIDNSVSYDSNYKKIIITTVVVLVFLVAFYFITVAILNKEDSSKSSSTKKDTGEVEIQSNEILVGTSFSIKDSEYLVVYYDTTDDAINGKIQNAVSTYRNASKDVNLYTVNMSDGLNKSYVSESGNSMASNASELAINGPTLIKFKDSEIVDYVEGVDRIVDYLK